MGFRALRSPKCWADCGSPEEFLIEPRESEDLSFLLSESMNSNVAQPDPELYVKKYAGWNVTCAFSAKRGVTRSLKIIQ